MPLKMKDEKAGVMVTCRQPHRRQLAARARLLAQQHTAPMSAFAARICGKTAVKEAYYAHLCGRR